MQSTPLEDGRANTGAALGNIAYDRESGRLINESMEPFYLMDSFVQIRLVDEAEHQFQEVARAMLWEELR